MAKFLSGRKTNLKLGITDHTVNDTVLQTIGKVGIGVTNAGHFSLYVDGPTNITGDALVGGGLTVSGTLEANNIIIDGGGNTQIGDDIVTRNLKATGITTLATLNTGDLIGVGATFSGNVSIAGTLTYEDVTNVDAVGLVTAREGIRIPYDNKMLQIGLGDDLQLYHQANNSYIKDNGTGSLRILGGNTTFMNAAENKTSAVFNVATSVDLYNNNILRLQTTGYGVTVYDTLRAPQLDITGIATISNLNFGGNTGITSVGGDFENINVTGISTFGGLVSVGGTTGTDGQYLRSTGVGVTWSSFPTMRTSQSFTATEGQTTFNFDYNVSLLDVFLNGVKLTPSEYTASNGSTVVLDSGCFAGDTIDLYSYNVASTGSSGGPGPAGPSGSKGQKGTSGNDGSDGSKGQKGQTGAGTSGAKGQKGEVGSGGSAGAKGQKGLDGTDADGAKGQKGETGTGSAGPAGSKGQKGAAGSAGSAESIVSVWTLGASGSSHYTFTGPGLTGAENDPTIYLVRGQSYRFTNNSGGSHPFQIRYNSNGTAYSDGITNNGASTGNIDFNVQYDAPDVLYYQCTAHSGMLGKIIILGDIISEGSWTASAGSAQTIDTITGVANNAIKTAEYTIHIENGSNMQAQKVLVMQDGTTAYSQEYAIMDKSGLLVSMSATISGGNLLLQATPETGVSGTTTYKITRQTMR